MEEVTAAQRRLRCHFASYVSIRLTPSFLILLTLYFWKFSLFSQVKLENIQRQIRVFESFLLSSCEVIVLLSLYYNRCHRRVYSPGHIRVNHGSLPHRPCSIPSANKSPQHSLPRRHYHRINNFFFPKPMV